MLGRDEREIKHLKAKIVRKNAEIAMLEAENNALGVRLHDRHSRKPAAYPGDPGRSLKDRFWRRYVNGGSGIWRLLFEVCDGGERLLRAMVRVGRKKHEH